MKYFSLNLFLILALFSFVTKETVDVKTLIKGKIDGKAFELNEAGNYKSTSENQSWGKEKDCFVSYGSQYKNWDDSTITISFNYKYTGLCETKPELTKVISSGIHKYFQSATRTPYPSVTVTVDFKGDYYTSSMGDQNGSSFTVTTVEKITNNESFKGDFYLVKGKFSCPLYSSRDKTKSLKLSDVNFSLVFEKR